jgi:polygalacturonase
MTGINMKQLAGCALSLFSFLAATTCFGQTDELGLYLRDLPFAAPEIRVPVFPNHVVSIIDHGAVPGGQTMNTGAFVSAIEACVKAGGGTVLVPPGLWLTGPIRLKSNINLHLAQGAVVLFSKKFEDHPLIAGFDGSSRRYRCIPSVSAYREENVAITGEGMFNGQGEAWWPVKRDKLNAGQWKQLVASGGAVTPDGKMWYPSRGAMEGEALLKTLDAKKGNTEEEFAKAREFLRPVMVQLVDCRHILIDGPAFVNSPSFHVQPVQCENVVIRNITVRTEWWAQNGDGIDLSACRNVLVYNCVVDAGDDALCIKPGTISRRQSPGPACENIVIADCIVYHGHGGFVIGSESYGGARNIAVRNCTFQRTDVGLRFKSGRGRGGLIEKIFIDGVTMAEIAHEAILFDMFYDASSGVASGGEAGSRKDPRIPEFRDFTMRKISCSGAERAVSITGLEEMPVKDILLEDATLQAEKGVSCTDAEGIILRGVRIVPMGGAMFSLNRTRGFEVAGGVVPANVDTILSVAGASSRDIRLTGIDLGGRKNAVVLGVGVKPDAVQVK